MFRCFMYILSFGMLFGANQQWVNYQGEFISSTSVIVKLDEGLAPLLGMESPLTMDMISGLHNVDRENNFDSFVPLFKNYNDFSSLHLEHTLHTYYVLSFKEAVSNFDELIQGLEAISIIDGIELNYRASAFLVPNDNYYTEQWALNNTGQADHYNGGNVGTPGCDIDAERAWDITIGDRDVVIAILDTGIDLDHPDLEDKLVGGYDFVNNDSTPNDGHMHGTACASIAAGSTNNGIGVSGVCWECSLMPVKVLSDAGYGEFDDIINGVEWASDNGADIISMSLGGGGYQSAFDNAIDYAVANGTAVFAASGNDNSGNLSYPAGYDNCIAVGAMSPCNERKNPSSCDGENFWGSNYGQGLDFLTPGVRIHSATLGSYISDFNGTSSACPHAAGVAGLIRSIAPGIPPDQLRLAMQINSVDIGSAGYDTQTGWGRLNAYNALLNLAEQADASVDVDVIDVEMSSNQTTTESFTISNGVDAEADLEYSIDESDYRWLDSNDEVSSNWIVLDNPVQVNFAHNDNAPSPIGLGFDFPLYGRSFNEMTINPNGWIGLEGDSNAWDNTTLPTSEVPGAAIFGFWDDLNPVNDGNSSGMAGYVYYQLYDNKAVVFFDGVVHWVGSGDIEGSYTFQMVMHQDGRIELNYLDMQGDINSATIGVQGSTNLEYVLISYNQNYVENDFSSFIYPKSEWFELSSLGGTILPGESEVIDVTIDSEGLEEGIYFDVISIQTNDYDNNLINIPITLEVTDACGQWELGDVNQDGEFNVQDVVIMLDIILNPEDYDECQLFAADINGDGSINVQDIVTLVNIILS